MARQLTITIDDEVWDRLQGRCEEHRLDQYVNEAVRQRCEQEDRSDALDAFTSDFGQPWPGEIQALGRDRFDLR